MSYSINVRAKTKQDARRQVTVKMAEVVAQQKVHAADAPAVVAAAHAFIDALALTDGKDITVTAYGSVSWQGGEDQVTYGNLSLTVNLIPSEQA